MFFEPIAWLATAASVPVPAAQARDTLLYKARLIMPEVSQVEIGVRVDDLIGKLCLGRARDTQVRTQREKNCTPLREESKQVPGTRCHVLSVLAP